MADLDGPQPMYMQIADILRTRITNGTYPPRTRIPSAADICDEFEVSRRTAVSAVGVLISEGRVQGAVGKGTYVVDPETPGEDQ